MLKGELIKKNLSNTPLARLKRAIDAIKYLRILGDMALLYEKATRFSSKILLKIRFVAILAYFTDKNEGNHETKYPSAI